jgi:hypothetical protein
MINEARIERQSESDAVERVLLTVATSSLNLTLPTTPQGSLAWPVAIHHMLEATPNRADLFIYLAHMVSCGCAATQMMQDRSPRRRPTSPLGQPFAMG